MSEKTILDKGFIRLVDNMGNDMSVIKAARVSYGNESKGEEADKKLIHYLMNNKHETPFEHITFTFHVKCPMYIARQWFRHRIGSFNEISGRYTEMEESYYHPRSMRKNTEKNKQSSGKGDWYEDEFLNMCDTYDDAILSAHAAYNKLLEFGLCREQARGVLPMAIYTEFYWSVNARSLFNFIELRTAKGAQWEIQQYGIAIFNLVKDIAPWTFEAFRMCTLQTSFGGESI